jgi:hypothetical protein
MGRESMLATEKGVGSLLRSVIDEKTPDPPDPFFRPALIKKCIGLLCKVAKIPLCALVYRIGNFLENCLKVGVAEIAKWIIPGSIGRLVDEYQGINCADTPNKQICIMCCRAQGDLNPDTGIPEQSNCLAKCKEKSDSVTGK